MIAVAGGIVGVGRCAAAGARRTPAFRVMGVALAHHRQLAQVKLTDDLVITGARRGASHRRIMRIVRQSDRRREHGSKRRAALHLVAGVATDRPLAAAATFGLITLAGAVIDSVRETFSLLVGR